MRVRPWFFLLVLYGAMFGTSVVHAEMAVASKSYVDQIVSGLSQKQVDWNQTDESAADFIKNKPDVMIRDEVETALTTKADVDDVRFTTVPSTEPEGNPPEGQVFIWFN